MYAEFFIEDRCRLWLVVPMVAAVVAVVIVIVVVVVVAFFFSVLENAG